MTSASNSLFYIQNKTTSYSRGKTESLSQHSLEKRRKRKLFTVTEMQENLWCINSELTETYNLHLPISPQFTELLLPLLASSTSRFQF